MADSRRARSARSSPRSTRAACTNEVTLFTESEFNRTGNANANIGTDHAWGSHHLVIGGAVHGGDLRHVPAARARRARRCGRPRQLDSDDVARSVRGDAGRLVRRAGCGDERDLPEPAELPAAESGVRVEASGGS